MTVQLTDEAISELMRKGRIVRCERLVCTECGQVVHDQPGRIDNQGGRFRCPVCGYGGGKLQTVDQHWHAADGTGPVSQYAIP